MNSVTVLPPRREAGPFFRFEFRMAIIVPVFFQAHHYEAHLLMAGKGLQLSISCLSFSAPAYGACGVRILTGASGWGCGCSPVSTLNAANHERLFRKHWSAQMDSFRYRAHFEGSRLLL